MKKIIVTLLLTFLAVPPVFAVEAAPRITGGEKNVSFTLEDRDRLIRLEVKMDQMDKRFEQVDKRFEQVDKRFEQMFNFLWILSGIFTTMTVSVIGFAYWDRRTMIAKAKEETLAEIEKDGRVKNLINALRELSKSDDKVAKVLKQFNLL